MMKVLWWLKAVGMMASTASIIRWRAESVPMVISVPQKSLSMEPTMPTMLRWAWAAAASPLTCLLSTSSLRMSDQFWRNLRVRDIPGTLHRQTCWPR